MPDKARFFHWRQNAQLVAFTLCMLEGNAIFGLMLRKERVEPVTLLLKDGVIDLRQVLSA